MTTSRDFAIDVRITYDFLCSWCWIGHRRFAEGVKLAGLRTPLRVRYAPFELNSAIPAEGFDRKTYRAAKFGSLARAQALDTDVAAAGRSVGIDYRFDLIERTVNSHLAHRLLVLTQNESDQDTTGRVLEAIFEAYFSRGQNISNADVLADLMTSFGADRGDVIRALAGGAGETETTAAVEESRAEGIRTVPATRIAGVQVSGAQPPEAFADALRAAEARILDGKTTS
jgi:predicted DsbA family dithiol-disulfide isomerase